MGYAALRVRICHIDAKLAIAIATIVHLACSLSSGLRLELHECHSFAGPCVPVSQYTYCHCFSHSCEMFLDIIRNGIEREATHKNLGIFCLVVETPQ